MLNETSRAFTIVESNVESILESYKKLDVSFRPTLGDNVSSGNLKDGIECV